MRFHHLEKCLSIFFSGCIQIDEVRLVYIKSGLNREIISNLFEL